MEETEKEMPTVFRNKRGSGINIWRIIVILALIVGGILLYNVFKPILLRILILNQGEKVLNELKGKMKGGTVQPPPVSNVR